MKKMLYIIPLLAFSMVSCNEESTNQGYHIVTFDLNYEEGKDVLQVVNDGEVLSKISDPFRQGYTFLYWSLEENGEEYTSFGQEINEDFTLYAIWEVNEIKTHLETVSYFINTIDSLEENVIHTTTEVDTLEAYTFIGYQFEYSTYSYFDRYTDIVVETICDPSSASLDKVGEAQYQKVDNNYYLIVDYVDGNEDDYYEFVPTSQSNDESFFGIGPTNLTLSVLKMLEQDLEENSIDAELYDITGLDLSNFDPNTSTNIPFSFSYEIRNSGSDGLYQAIYTYQGVYTIDNGLISMSTIDSLIEIAVDGQLYAYYSNHSVNRYTNGEFSNFSGTRFDYNDYPLYEEPVA